MNKKVFLSILLILVGLAVLLFFTFSFKGEEIIELGKEKVVELSKEKIFTQLNKIDNNQFTDSLRSFVNNYYIKIDSFDTQTQLNKIEELNQNFEVILIDKQIDKNEFDFITKTN